MTDKLDEAIQNLANLLETENSFQKTVNAFLEITVMPEFDEHFTNKDNPTLRALVDQCMRMYTKGEAEITRFSLYYIEKHQLYHGGFLFRDQPGLVFYFADRRQGMTSFYDDEQTHFMRITEGGVPEGTVWIDPEEPAEAG